MNHLPCDLQVELQSTSLSGQAIDLIVSGSIAAIETPRLARSLRRLGAEVNVCLTEGGSRFITPLALEWASANSVKTDWNKDASHIAQTKNLVVAPASANFIAKAAAGISDSPALALFASHLGQGSKILMLPNMHQSLSASPIFLSNKAKLEELVTFLTPRQEEAKDKFPAPNILANDIAHELNRKRNGRSILLTAGGTYTDIDMARHIGNKSSGRLGSHISEELYRRGFKVDILMGTREQTPQSANYIFDAHHFQTMAQKLDELTGSFRYDAIVCAAAISDFTPVQTSNNKIRSDKVDTISLELKRTPKLLKTIKGRSNCTIAFKYLGEDSRKARQEIAQNYLDDYDLDSIIVNFASDISKASHRAFGYSHQNKANENILANRDEITDFIATRALAQASGDRN